MNMSRLIIISLMIVSCVILTLAQGSPTGTITGTTEDQSGSAIPGSRVIATNIGTSSTFEAVSNESGTYILRSLPVGNYTITVETAGFKKMILTDVNVRVNDEVRLDVTLPVGGLNEEVTVTAETALVSTTSSTLKTVIDERRINELPLNGRDPNSLVQLVAGVQPDTRTSLTSGATYPGAVSVSSNGGRGNTTNYVLDGGSNNDPYSNQSNPMPNPDALQEFSVQTNNFSAEYGRNLGAVVNAVTKSGTNNFHGTLFEYVRNDAFNATNFFTPGKRDGLKRNQFGGTIGGPLPLPHFGEGGPVFDSGRDRSFFFFSYQGTRTRQAPADNVAVVPTAAQRAGNFGSTRIADPSSGLPCTATDQRGCFANNIIPVSRFNPVAQRLLNFIPLPNEPGGILRFAVPILLDDDQYMLRLDHKFSESNNLFGRYWFSKAAQPAYLDTGNYLASSFGRTWKNRIIALNDTHIFSPRVVNNTVFTFNQTDNVNTHVYPESLQSMGANYYNDATPQIQLTVAGSFGINTGDTNTFARKEYQIANTTRITTSRHYISIGGDYSYFTNDIVNNFRANGQIVFNNAAGFTGNALADFFLGKFSTFTQGVGEYKNTIAHNPGFFIQDDYRVNKKLVLNLGLRWDPFIPYIDANDRIAGFREGQRSQVYVNAPAGLLYPSDPGLPEGGYEQTLWNFGPRLGFAYDLTGDGKTSIRGGYGIFFDRPNAISTNSAANQAPFGTVLTFNGTPLNSLSEPYAGRINPFPQEINPGPNVAFTTPISVFSHAQGLKNARLQSYNLSFEREIFPSYLVRVAYAGSKGERLSVVNEINPAIYALGATTGTTNARRRLAPIYGSIASVESTGFSNYNSLQLTLDKRFSKGFSVLANYTLSKSTDNSSENKDTGITQINPFDLSFDEGLSNFDHRHRFTASFIYEFPGNYSNGFADAFLGGWNLSGILTMQSGTPFSVTSGVDNARSGTGGQLADLVGDPNLPDNRTRGEQVARWFNTSAYTVNALGTFGNSGRNTLVGPGFTSLNIGLHKNFSLRENVRLQFRAEAFNALNNVNLNLPSSNVSSSTFGRITSAGDPRILQFAVRLMF